MSTRNAHAVIGRSNATTAGVVATSISGSAPRTATAATARASSALTRAGHRLPTLRWRHGLLSTPPATGTGTDTAAQTCL